MTKAGNASNIVLIGMPGVGKSTAGVLLAKRLSMAFMDTDLVIQASEGRCLQDIIDSEGIEAFCQIEEQVVCDVVPDHTVIATGGSVVYGELAMQHLAGWGLVLHLHLPFDTLENRIRDLDSRGVVMPPGLTLRDLYENRQPLYKRWADATIDCSDMDLEQTVDALERLSRENLQISDR